MLHKAPLLLVPIHSDNSALLTLAKLAQGAEVCAMDLEVPALLRIWKGQYNLMPFFSNLLF